MDDHEPSNIYHIPANYTDSGKLLGGMLDTRNTVEAAILLLVVGYPELMWLHIPLNAKIIVMTVTLVPIAVAALMGIGGDSLFQFLRHVVLFFLKRQKLHYKRIGYRYEIKPKDPRQKRRTVHPGSPARQANSQRRH